MADDGGENQGRRHRGSRRGQRSLIQRRRSVISELVNHPRTHGETAAEAKTRRQAEREFREEFFPVAGRFWTLVRRGHRMLIALPLPLMENMQHHHWAGHWIPARAVLDLDTNVGREAGGGGDLTVPIRWFRDAFRNGSLRRARVPAGFMDTDQFISAINNRADEDREGDMQELYYDDLHAANSHAAEKAP